MESPSPYHSSRFNLAFNRKSLFFSLLDRHLLYSNIKCTRITARGLLLSLQRYRPWVSLPALNLLTVAMNSGADQRAFLAQIVEIEPYTVRHLVAVGGDHILAILAPRCGERPQQGTASPLCLVLLLLLTRPNHSGRRGDAPACHQVHI